jgi:hypothetical protein
MAEFRSVLDTKIRPEDEAIAPDTTLEGLALGPGRAAVSTIRKVFDNAARKRAPEIITPEIGSKVAQIDKNNAIMDELRKRDWSKTPFKSSPFEKSPKELERIAKEETLDRLNSVLDKNLRKALHGMSSEAGAAVSRRLNNDSETTYKRGGKVSGASKRADGIAQRGKTKGRMC